MNYKRAIWFNLLAYLVAFGLGALAVAMYGVESPNIEDVPMVVWLIGIISALVAVTFFCWLFFKKTPKVKKNAKNGFLFGLVALALGFALDVVTVFPFSNGVEDPFGLLLEYYSTTSFMLMVAGILVACTLVGKFVKK